MRWLILLVALLAAHTVEAQEPASGRDLYRGACAACHGTDGTGLPQAALGFDVAVPDFTDCSFATPEADADWLAVVHDGGPARAFDRRMPAFGEALKEDEILRVLDYIHEFCGDGRWPRGELNLPRALVTEKAFPENETVLTTTVALDGAGAVANELLYERRLGARTQFEVIVPFVSHDTGGQWRSGLGDVGAAVKRVLVHSRQRGSIFSVTGEVVFPTGKESEGLGSGVAVFEPFLAFGQILPADAFLQVQAGAELPRRGAKEAFWRAALGRTIVSGRFGRSWSPIVELLAAREMESGARVEWDAVPQMQVSLSKRQHVLISAGVRVPVTGRSARGAQLMTYVLWDWFDGGIRDGWR
ncbi:MAG: cytochrome c [Acidimicrobiia bacterium]|nr:cytochrome c [Acidimicrobiia bacterium]